MVEILGLKKPLPIINDVRPIHIKETPAVPPDEALKNIKN